MMEYSVKQFSKHNSPAPLNGTAADAAIPSWNPIRLREYLARHEGKIWKRQNTLMLLQRADEVDALIEKLMRSAGIKIESGY